MKYDYIPKRGDLVWIDFSPQSGHEQSGRRPALCISPQSYNQKVGLAIFCPITNAIKGYPFEVLLPENLQVSGVILTDQVKSLDWRSRQVEYLASLPATVTSEVLSKIRTLI
ncbi:MAG: endoribonuclease MazF [Bacillota bacterium]|nr:endoribonuclease MazF [Bacillota bacterium]